MTTYEIPDGPKMLRETLCVAQTHVGNSADPRAAEHVARLQRLIDECDRHRPLGPDGKHGDRHTPTCGCEDAAPVVRPSLFDRPPRILVTQHGRWRWSARVEHGLIVYRREDGGPYAFTRKRAEDKGRRLLHAYLRPSREREQTFEVTP